MSRRNSKQTVKENDDQKSDQLTVATQKEELRRLKSELRSEIVDDMLQAMSNEMKEMIRSQQNEINKNAFFQSDICATRGMQESGAKL